MERICEFEFHLCAAWIVENTQYRFLSMRITIFFFATMNAENNLAGVKYSAYTYTVEQCSFGGVLRIYLFFVPNLNFGTRTIAG